MDIIRGSQDVLHGAHRLDSGPKGPRGIQAGGKPQMQEASNASPFLGLLNNLTGATAVQAPPSGLIAGNAASLTMGLNPNLGVQALSANPANVADPLQHPLSQQQLANRDVGTQLESVFTSILVKEMRQTLDGATLFGNNGGDVYGGMLDTYLSQHLAPTGFLGIGAMVEKQLNRRES